jgi:hypothetical protein
MLLSDFRPGFTPVSIQMMLREWCWLTPPTKIRAYERPESIRKWQQGYHKHPGWKKLKYFFQLHFGWAPLTADHEAPDFWPKAFRA